MKEDNKVFKEFRIIFGDLNAIEFKLKKVSPWLVPGDMHPDKPIHPLNSEAGCILPLFMVRVNTVTNVYILVFRIKKNDD